MAASSSIDHLTTELRQWARRERRLKWRRIAILNTAPSTTSGKHWICSMLDPLADPPMVLLVDPLPKPLLKPNTIEQLRRFATTSSKSTGHQSDSWSCGYHSLWYQLQLHHLTKPEFEVPDDPIFSTTPKGWFRIVWELLRTRDNQRDIDRENAITVGIASLMSSTFESGLDEDGIMIHLTNYNQGLLEMSRVIK